MAGTNKRALNLTKGPAVILIEPQLPENIGMVARAMANFGLSELRLVAPREAFPHEKTVATASKADHILAQTRIYDDLAHAARDCHFIIATTARHRDNFKPVFDPAEGAQQLWQKQQAGQKTAIIFGRERWGLTNSEVSLADIIVSFPVNPAFASLNLAQAVLLMSYEWHKQFLAQKAQERDEQVAAKKEPAFRQASKDSLYQFFSQLEQALDVRGYFRSQGRKPVMIQHLRDVFSRPGFSENELYLLRGVISSLDRFSPARPKGAAAPDLTNRESKAIIKEARITNKSNKGAAK